MDHTIFVHGTQSAVIQADTDAGTYTVTAYVNAQPSVAYDCATAAEAERWARAVIQYPDNA